MWPDKTLQQEDIVETTIAPARRRKALACLGSAVLLAALPPTALHAEPQFPARPITIIVPYPAGGIGDQVARIVGEKISEAWGQPVLVEARPGGNSNIGTMAVSRAAPDGYTWLVATPALTANPSLYKGLWDPLRDFTGVGIAVHAPNLVTVPSQMNVNNLQEFIALAKRNPGKLNYGNPGVGSSLHLNTELFKAAAGVDIVSVNYKGQPPTIVDLVRGDLSVVFLSVALAAPHIKAGKLKPLAIVSDGRSPLFPTVPTMAEAGYPAANVVPWYGFAIPAATPREIAAKINLEINRALQAPDVQERLRNLGTTPAKPSSLPEIRAVMQSDFSRYRTVIHSAAIKPE